MNKIKVLFFATLIFNSLNSQTSSMEAWANLLNKKELAEYFSGQFETLGIIVEETNERFTVHHKGDHFELTDGIEENNVNYIIPLKLENIKNMQSHAVDDKISSNESFSIMKVLFTPLTKVSLQNPWMSSRILMWLMDIENNIHVYLIGHDSLPANTHTLQYSDGSWKVENGLHGSPDRIFKMSAEQAVDYQKHAFSAMKNSSISNWWKYGVWYKEWRKTVSVIK